MDAPHEDGPTDPVADALRAREALTAMIVAQINTNGYFLAHVDPQPHQQLIDLRWAAQVAGRVLGRRTRTHASAVGARQPGKITVLIAPDEVRTVTDDHGRSVVRTLLEELVELHHLLLRGGPAAG